jgi:hypothetical protein
MGVPALGRFPSGNRRAAPSVMVVEAATRCLNHLYGKQPQVVPVREQRTILILTLYWKLADCACDQRRCG